MYLTESEIAKIIQLKAPNALIDESIASRQLKVIHRAFNHLCHPENKFIYIGDEVGLGKTYIAIGVASLLRKYGQQLFPSVLTKNYYQDVVIVPKKHLQVKWISEYEGFIKNNYQDKDSLVKGTNKAPIATRVNHNSINLFKDTTASFHLFRMSSFSIARPSSEGLNNWTDNLRKRICCFVGGENHFTLTLFDRAKKDFGLDEAKGDGNNVDFDKFKRLYAWLLNICLPQIECLIVDEAHNFKHGIEQEGVAIRNKLISRYFGAISIEKDRDLLDDYPELRNHVGSRVEKLICLSATPINKSVEEIANQIDCFLPIHELSKKGGIEKTLSERNADFIKKNINAFMIRGLMELQLGDQRYSRNQYRKEHRFGNVTKDNESFMKLDSDLHGLIMGVVQYNVIKEIGEASRKIKGKKGVKNNKSFEIGMLASYESFNQSNVKEYEDNIDNKDGSIDKNVLDKLVASYEETFHNKLPHPKQDRLVETLFEYTKQQEKALVFVRRIGSVVELEQRLLYRYEDYLHQKVLDVCKKYKQQPVGVEKLLKSYEHRHLEQEKKSLFVQIGKYLTSKGVHVSSEIKALSDNELSVLLYFIFREDDDFETTILTTLQRKNIQIKNDLKRLSREKTQQYLEAWKRDVAEEGNADIDNKGKRKDRDPSNEIQNNFFFNRFFVKSQETIGSKYRLKTHRELWFEMNYRLFNNTFKIFKVKEELPAKLIQITVKENDKKRQIFNRIQEVYLENISVGEHLPVNVEDLADFGNRDDFEVNTFITQLFTKYCYNEVKVWIDNNLNSETLLSDLENLVIIVKQMFNHGSGLLPAYLADCFADNYEQRLFDFLTDDNLFGFVLTEIRQVIKDYDTILKKNLGNKNIRKTLENLSPIVGTSGEHKIDRSRIATQFKMPTYPYILITTDILKEGVDLHSYCQDVFHYGIAWNPTDMEQRTGRVDRIGSLSSRKIKAQKAINVETKVHIFYPYLSDTLEVNQVKRVFEGMNDFIEVFYNDLDATKSENKHASTDEIISAIPPQKTGKLTSKFDYDNFVALKSPHIEIQHVKQQIIANEDAERKLKDLEVGLQQAFTFYNDVGLDLHNQLLSGTVKLTSRKDRRGPFVVSIVTHPLDSFRPALKLSSFVCKIEAEAEENKIVQRLTSQGYQNEYEHEWLLGYKVFDWETDSATVVQELEHLVSLVDDLEAEHIGKDAVVFV